MRNYLFVILACLLLVGTASAATWVAYNGHWIDNTTNATHTIEMWNATGTTNWTPPAGVGSVEYLVVGGGGGGGGAGAIGAGGGAGGVMVGTGFFVTPGINLSISVGNFGIGGDAIGTANGRGTNGTNSYIGSGTEGVTLITAIGGGGGGTGGGSFGFGSAGGSGGGSTNNGAIGIANPTGQGSNGGLGSTSGNYGSGGGGGKTTAGGNGTTTVSGIGGNGYNASAFGITAYGGIIATGGGGSTYNGGSGGASGGSFNANHNNGTYSATGQTAYNNTGSGGGGAGATTSGTYYGGSGGSGIVIISYITPTGGAVTPVASFTQSTTSGTAPLSVQFNDTSTNTPTAWQWNATNVTGNNTPFTFSTIKNPTYTFGFGNFSIALNASNSAGGNVSAQDTWINVTLLPPNANFHADITTSAISQNVSFTDDSNQFSAIDDYYWDFGDSNTSTSQNPIHAYYSSGMYTVKLRANNNTYGYTWMNKTNYITVSMTPPLVSFNSNAPTLGLEPLTVQFTDTSVTNILTYNWTHRNTTPGDNINVSFSTSANPTHSFGAGKWVVSLTVANATGYNTTSKWVNVTTTPVIDFTSNKVLAGLYETIYFNDTSSGSPNAWVWLFGDGTLSTLQNPSHAYTSLGLKSVQLHAYNLENTTITNTSTKTNYINVVSEASHAPVAHFSGVPTIVLLGLPVQFTDESEYVPTSWFWDFGDLSYSYSQNPSHLYSTLGNYTVSLNVTNVQGSNVITKTNYIRVSPTAATGFTQQDIIMASSYTLTLFITDLYTGYPIPVVTVIDSLGNTQTTSVGTFIGTYPYSTVVVYLSSAGYTSKAMSYLMDEDRIENLSMTLSGWVDPNATSNQNVRYWTPPHIVKFTVKDAWAKPVSGVTVNAIYVEASAPWAWITDWMGPPDTVSVQNTTLTGHTGTDGAITFLLVDAAQYDIKAFKTGEVDASMRIYPKDDQYTIWAYAIGGNTSPMFAKGYNELDVIKFTTNGTEINSTAGRITVVYTDSLAQTSFATITINQTSSPEEHTVATYTSYASGNFTRAFNLPNTRDEDYIVRMRSSGTVFTNVSRDYGVTFPPGPIGLGIPEPLLVYVGMVALIFIALCFTRTLPGPATIVIMFFAWIFFFMGWWANLAPAWMTITALSFYSVLAVLFNVMIRSKKRIFE